MSEHPKTYTHVVTNAGHEDYEAATVVASQDIRAAPHRYADRVLVPLNGEQTHLCDTDDPDGCRHYAPDDHRDPDCDCGDG